MRAWASIAAGVILVASLTGSAPAGIRVGILPASVQVDPGETFDVELAILEGGSPFNAYDALVRFDPAILRFVPRTQAAQEGPLFTSACPVRFHSFSVANDSTLSITDGLLCAGVSVTGPGVLYRLRFTAGPDPAVTQLRLIAATRFFDAGIGVFPVLTESAEVRVGEVTGLNPVPVFAAQLSVFPNPFNPRTSILVNLLEPGPARVTVYSASGRRVRNLLDTSLAVGRQRLNWEGRDDAGRPAGSGTYYICLQTANGDEVRRVTLLK